MSKEPPLKQIEDLILAAGKMGCINAQACLKKKKGTEQSRHFR